MRGKTSIVTKKFILQGEKGEGCGKPGKSLPRAKYSETRG